MLLLLLLLLMAFVTACHRVRVASGESRKALPVGPGALTEPVPEDQWERACVAALGRRLLAVWGRPRGRVLCAAASNASTAATAAAASSAD